MLVSALLTSVLINFGLCILFWTLYSTLRKQPGNFSVYAPRLLAEGNSQNSHTFNLGRVLPAPGWVGCAWKSSEEQLLSSAGLDAIVFRRLINFSLRVTTLAGVIGIFILLLVNFSGDQLEDVDFANLARNSLDIFTISNVKNGSKRLWVHFGAVYFLTIFICFLLFHEYKYVSSKRISYFLSSKPHPSHFTILVRGVPANPGGSVGDSVERFFRQYHPNTYLSHVVVRRTSRVQHLISNAKKLYRRLIDLRKELTAAKSQHGGFCGLFRVRRDVVDDYERKLEDLEDSLLLEQSDFSLAAGEEVRAAFVSFKSRYGAALAVRLQQSNNPTQWVTEEAPEPHDVYWPLFSESFIRRWITQLLVLIAYVLLTLLFLIPVVLVQGLTNLPQLEAMFPFLANFLKAGFIRQVITGYLPNLILLLFLLAIPDTMKLLSSVQGHISYSEIVRSASNKFLWFTIWNIFFGNVLSGSAISEIFIFLDPTNVPSRLAVAVPAQASFFIAYVVTSGWTSTSVELFRPLHLLWSIIRKPCKKSRDVVNVPAFRYHSAIPRVLFLGLLGITYFFLAPLILPFILVYFCLGYIIYTNQFMNVYSPNYETAGRFWPIVHNSMIFSLLLMHAIAVGIFTLKKLPLASSLIFPLPIMTLIFNSYCRKRFLPIFLAYPAETLIQKDRDDLNDASTAEFLNTLTTAYQDPALIPVQYSSDSDRETTPLLSSCED